MATKESKKAKSPLIVIKKYSNRRLYDTEASQYVTLSDVEEMIRQGNEIQVVDAQTGEDLTRAVMLQIICESKSQQELLPISFLRQIIQASGNTVRSSIQDFLSLGLQAQKDLHSQFTQWMRAGVAMNPFASTLSAMFGNVTGPPRSPAEASEEERNSSEAAEVSEADTSKPTVEKNVPQSPPQEEDVTNQIEALRQQLASLQNQIDKLGEK